MGRAPVRRVSAAWGGARSGGDGCPGNETGMIRCAEALDGPRSLPGFVVAGRSER